MNRIARRTIRSAHRSLDKLDAANILEGTRATAYGSVLHSGGDPRGIRAFARNCAGMRTKLSIRNTILKFIERLIAMSRQAHLIACNVGSQVSSMRFEIASIPSQSLQCHRARISSVEKLVCIPAPFQSPGQASRRALRRPSLHRFGKGAIAQSQMIRDQRCRIGSTNLELHCPGITSGLLFKTIPASRQFLSEVLQARDPNFVRANTAVIRSLSCRKRRSDGKPGVESPGIA